MFSLINLRKINAQLTRNKKKYFKWRIFLIAHIYLVGTRYCSQYPCYLTSHSGKMLPVEYRKRNLYT